MNNWFVTATSRYDRNADGTFVSEGRWILADSAREALDIVREMYRAGGTEQFFTFSVQA